MQKYKKSLAVLLMCCLMLGGCGADKESQEIESSSQENSTVANHREAPAVSDEDDQMSLDGAIGTKARELYKMKGVKGYEESKEIMEFLGCKEDDVSGCNFITSEDDFKSFTVGLLTCFADTEAQVESNIAATLTESGVPFMVAREGNRIVIGLGDTSDVNLDALSKYAAATSNLMDSDMEEDAGADSENNISEIDEGSGVNSTEESSSNESQSEASSSVPVSNELGAPDEGEESPSQPANSDLGEEITTSTETVEDSEVEEGHVDPSVIPQSAKEAAKANAVTEETVPDQVVGGPDAELSDGEISGFDDLIQREDDLAFPSGSESSSDKPQGVN